MGRFPPKLGIVFPRLEAALGWYRTLSLQNHD
jgi:hypothetical protein